MPRLHVSAQLRRTVATRAYDCCEYCLSQADFGTQRFSVEHIVPVSAGGSNDLDNLALACQGCNAYKSDRLLAMDPVDKTYVPLYNPRLDKWDEHFGWYAQYTVIVGLTPTGRATVEVLKLNRPALINLRRALFAFGEHPPRHLWT
jgi:hypothetical protein